MWRDKLTGEVVTRHDEIRALRPNVSFPIVMTDEGILTHDFDSVIDTPAPTVGEYQTAYRNGVTQDNSGNWVQVWSVRDWTTDEIDAAKAALQKNIVDATQKRLDDFAQTRNYDGILSACTYATSTVPKFQAEGQYCVNARDNTWATLYNILAEVQAGTHPVPTGYADIEPELPVLVWP